MPESPDTAKSEQPAASVWPDEAFTGVAQAMHARTCCPMDENSQCEETDLPLEDARAALEFVAPAVEGLIESRYRMALRLRSLPDTIEAVKAEFVVHGIRRAANDGLDSFATEHPEVFLMDGAEHLIALLRTHLLTMAEQRLDAEAAPADPDAGADEAGQ